MALADFNFAQPLWLWALLLIPVGWIWAKYWSKRRKLSDAKLHKFADPELLPHIMIDMQKNNSNNNFGLLYTLLLTCLIFALANPRWSFKEIDAYEPSASMVILLDLSTTMNAEDIKPARIIRARQSIEDLLNLSNGLKVGLIGFAAIPHLISPITDDIQTIKNYLPALDTDLTNMQGNSFGDALAMAAELLTNEPGTKKSILLVSDGNFNNNDYSKEIAALTAQNIDVYVMGVGTIQGAPFRNRSGVLQKQDEKIIISKLNKNLLQTIAKQGHGMYIEANHSDFGIQSLLNKAENINDARQLAKGKVRQWDDRYYIFLLPAALILLYLMRARALYVFLCSLMLTGLYSETAYAFDLNSYFINSEQKAKIEFVQGNFQQAATLFNDPYRKGVALYRAGQYSDAEQLFAQVQRLQVKTRAMYNAGNAQMQQQKWQDAIDSYEAVLKVEPNHEDAKHNLELARKMLRENPPKKDDKSDCDCKNNSKTDKDATTQDQNKSEQQQAKNETPPNKPNEDPKEESKSDEEQKDLASQQENQNKKSSRDASNSAETQNAAASTQNAAEQARAEQWLKRIDSDIKVFLKNKFYIEDMLSSQ